ncbi:MAG TPA: DUF4105 domain-containing protein [Gammaproteobacteria bacterium]|jgi:hypothetical protein
MARPVHILVVAVLFVAVVLGTVWGAAMLHFTVAGPAGNLLAAAVAVAGVAALIGVLLARWRRRALGLFAVLFAALLGWWSTLEPSNDREWKPEVAKAPYATVDGNLVTVHNVRNFDYRSATDFSPAYYDRTYNLDDLNAADVIASYWMGPDIAHIFVSFSFADRDYLSVSIERRDEKGEGYSTVRGLFRQYELIYVAADERDLIRLRTNFRDDPPENVYIYRVSAKPENLRRLFMAYIGKMNELKEQPEFYNTLLTNCTSNIWLHTRVNPGHLGYSWKVLLSGHVPEYLYENHRLDEALPFAELQARSLVNEAARAHGDDPDFSRAIRAGLPGMPD